MLLNVQANLQLKGLLPNRKDAPSMVSVLMPDRGMPDEEQRARIEAILMTINVNMSACHFRLGGFDRAVECASAALHLNSAFPKALYRRATALLRLQPPKLTLALGDLQAAQKAMLPQSDPVIEKLISDLSLKIKQQEDAEDSRLISAVSKMFL